MILYAAKQLNSALFACTFPIQFFFFFYYCESVDYKIPILSPQIVW